MGSTILSGRPQESELERLTRAREAETKFIREQNELEIAKAKEMSGIETAKFKNMVDAIGSDTIASIANAGPENQVSVALTLHCNSNCYQNSIVKCGCDMV